MKLAGSTCGYIVWLVYQFVQQALWWALWAMLQMKMDAHLPVSWSIATRTPHTPPCRVKMGMFAPAGGLCSHQHLGFVPSGYLLPLTPRLW